MGSIAVVGLIGLGCHGQAILKGQGAGKKVFAGNSQEVPLGFHVQGDHPLFRILHLLRRFDGVIQNIAEQGINIAIRHEAHTAAVGHAGNGDVQAVAGEHFIRQHHVQRGILGVGRGIENIHQLPDFFQFCPIFIVTGGRTHGGNPMLNVVAFQADRFMDLPVLLIAALFNAQQIGGFLCPHFGVRFPQVAHAHDHGHRGEHDHHHANHHIQLRARISQLNLEQQINHHAADHHTGCHKQKKPIIDVGKVKHGLPLFILAAKPIVPP